MRNCGSRTAQSIYTHCIAKAGRQAIERHSLPIWSHVWVLEWPCGNCHFWVGWKCNCPDETRGVENSKGFSSGTYCHLESSTDGWALDLSVVLNLPMPQKIDHLNPENLQLSDLERYSCIHLSTSGEWALGEPKPPHRYHQRTISVPYAICTCTAPASARASK